MISIINDNNELSTTTIFFMLIIKYFYRPNIERRKISFYSLTTIINYTRVSDAIQLTLILFDKIHIINNFF